MENKSEFWENVSAVAVTPVAIAAGLAKGTYDIFCGVPGHQAQGMNVDITVG